MTNDFPPRSGGIEQFVANLLTQADPDTVRVITANHPDAGPYDDALPYEVLRVGPRPLLPMPWLAARVRAEAADHGADAIVFGAAWPLCELASAVPLPSIALTHGHEAGMVKVGAGLAVRHALRDVDAIGVISDYTRGLLASWIPRSTAVYRLPPGVDVHRFTPDVDGAVVRRRYGIDPATPLALCLSRLVPRKGQDVLIEAWPAVVERVADARLLIAGTGPQEPALRRRVTKLDLNRHVTFTGDVPSSELPAFHTAADVFVMPCRTRLLGLDVEGLGIVYLEAQACGRPVVAGTSGGAPEALVHDETGLVVDGRDVTAVADATAELLADPERRLKMGHAGREFVTREYAWEVVHDRFASVIHEVAVASRA
ncbi:MAG TPA: glycosyltransferase family 4 protein [Egibacteraceae bacterium]|nr:glycosyltransferase family 4 protein [Egibacteraceae bacterium]